jgi:hypothetical protein
VGDFPWIKQLLLLFTLKNSPYRRIKEIEPVKMIAFLFGTEVLLLNVIPRA